MNLFEKVDKLNHMYSYNVFAFSCIFSTILFLIPLFYPSRMSIFINISDNMENKLLIAYIFWNIIFCTNLLISFIIFLIEKELKIFIKQDFILHNKYIKIFRHTCMFISLFCAIILILYFLNIGVDKIIKPSDLIYYDIHAK